ncbi:MAG: hypothetical protein K2X39_02735 [Silvanigrellaceae bacterium]|nr:hypothetical protein [Silvanigrellaceae bacterium]
MHPQIIRAQDKSPCNKMKVQGWVNGLETECIVLDSVFYYQVISQKNIHHDVFIDSLNQWFDVTEADTIFLTDSITIYKNLSEIHNLDGNYVIYPFAITKLKHLNVINNVGYFNKETFAKVPPLDSLLGLYFGYVSNDIHTVPKILNSPNLLQVNIWYAGTNEKFIIKVIKQCYKHPSLKNLNVYELGMNKFPKPLSNHLILYQKKFIKKGKKLFY